MDDNRFKLTMQMLRDMKPGIFAQGEMVDGPSGIAMTNSGDTLRWVAVRGDIADWAVYVHWANRSYDWVRDQGDKVYFVENIRAVIDCDDETMSMYRY